jgi:hypothetical protein
MSGIGFQKLQGQGTSAYEQLQKTAELIQKIEQLNYPDIYKLAKMFAPNMELTAITKVWAIGGGNANYALNFEGRYFGYWTIHHTHDGIGEVPGEKTSLSIYDDTQEVHWSLIDKYADGTHNRSTSEYKFTGFASRLTLAKPASLGVGFSHGVNIQFIGFKLGDTIPDPVEPEEFITINYFAAPFINGYNYRDENNITQIESIIYKTVTFNNPAPDAIQVKYNTNDFVTRFFMYNPVLKSLEKDNDHGVYVVPDGTLIYHNASETSLCYYYNLTGFSIDITKDFVGSILIGDKEVNNLQFPGLPSVITTQTGAPVKCLIYQHSTGLISEATFNHGDSLPTYPPSDIITMLFIPV